MTADEVRGERLQHLVPSPAQVHARAGGRVRFDGDVHLIWLVHLEPNGYEPAARFDAGSDRFAGDKHCIVLHAIAILPGLPKHLAKPFMLLAVTAKHRTGLARPGKTVITKNWGIPYSSWHRNVQELEELGLVRQVVFGYDKTGQAAEYELLHVEPDPTGGTPTEPREGSSSSTSTRNPPLSGRGPTPRNRATSAALTDHETQEWLRIRQRLLAGLTPGDRDRIEAEAQEFDQLPQLQRTAVRLACLGKEELLVDELARSPRAGRPAYEGGARAVLPAMWSRLATVARAYGVDIGDRTVAEPQTVCDLGTAFPMLRGWMDAMAEHTEATAAHTS